MGEEGEYRNNSEVSKNISDLVDSLKSADINSARGKSFVDFTLFTKLTSRWQEQLNDLKSQPFPAPGTETSHRNYYESELRISETRLAMISNSMDYNRMTFPGYKEDLAMIEDKWTAIKIAARQGDDTSKLNKLLDRVTDEGTETLLQNSRAKE